LQNPFSVTSEQKPRPRIADIIRDSGKMGTDQPTASQGELAAAVSAVSGTPAGVLMVSETLADELAKRFRGLSAKADIESDLDAPYATSGRALILALQACNHTLSAAFDTASGAILQTKKPLSLLSSAFTLTIAMADRDATTHLTSHVEHIGMDWGQNKKILDELLAKTNEYLNLFNG
jgi:hypothetical protein